MERVIDQLITAVQKSIDEGEYVVTIDGEYLLNILKEVKEYRENNEDDLK